MRQHDEKRQEEKKQEQKKQEQPYQEQKKHEEKKQEQPEDKALTEAVAKQKEYLEALQRLQAEFENFRKRNERESLAFREYAASEFVKKLLPVLDSFELALKNSQELEKFRKGVELIYAQLYSTLEEMGLKGMDSVNKKFDPYRHEVLMVDSSSKCSDDTVVEEFQKGYMFKDAVIRHSKVKIAKSEICKDKQAEDAKQIQKN